MRAIDADALNSIKFHQLPYTHITPSDADAESYKRGWNDAIDSIIENAPTIEPKPRTGEWIDDNCSECGFYVYHGDMRNYCPKCGAKMNGGKEE